MPPLPHDTVAITMWAYASAAQPHCTTTLDAGHNQTGATDSKVLGAPGAQVTR